MVDRALLLRAVACGLFLFCAPFMALAAVGWYIEGGWLGCLLCVYGTFSLLMHGRHFLFFVKMVILERGNRGK